MNSEDVQSEINQTQKDKYSGFHLQEGPRVVKLIETESGKVGTKGWGLGEGNGARDSVGKMKKLWRWMEMVAQQYNVLICMNCTLKHGYNGQYYTCFTTMKTVFKRLIKTP